MKCEIFTEDRWNRFMQNRLAKAELRECIEHFSAGGCEGCLKLLEQMDIAAEEQIREEFNNAGDRSCTRAGTGTVSEDVISPAIDDAGALAARRPVTEGQSFLLERVKTWLIPGRNLNMVWGGAAALLLVAIILVPQLHLMDRMNPTRDSGGIQTFKGVTAPVSSIHLRFATAYRDKDGKLVVTEGVTGGKYRDAEMVFLHYDLKRDGYVYLIAVHPDNGFELLNPGQLSPQSAGEHEFPNADDIRGVSLLGLKGRYAIIGIYSPAPLDYQHKTLPMVRKSLDVESGLFRIGSQNGNQERISSDIVYLDLSDGAG